MLTLYGYPNSRSLRAAWALEEVNAQYQYVKVDLLKGEGRKPAYLSVNPGGKVPALVEDGLVLTESAAIVTYIGDRYPDAGLVPQDGTRERARYLQWCFFCIGELEQPLWTMAKHRFALPEDWRVPAVIDTARKELDVAMRVLESGLAKKSYILGEDFTAADILISHTLGWAKKAEVPPRSEALLAYMDRTLSRPARSRALDRETQAAASE